MANEYGNHCPLGGQFYACNSKSFFVGCCASDPCANDCPAGNMRPTGFAAEMHGNTTDTSCPKGAEFYTCVYSGKSPDTFWGCCKSNPCAQGSCPTADLAGAYLGSPAQIQAYIGSTPSASPSSSATPPPEKGSSTNVAAIAGGVAGGVVVVLILIGLLIFYLRRNKKAKKAQAELEQRQSVPGFVAGGANEKKGPGGFEQQDAPPGYTSPLSSPQLNHSATFSPQSPQTQWAHQAEVSELPAPLPFSPMTPGTKSPHENRFSELPAGAADVSPRSPEIRQHRLSELPSEPVGPEQHGERGQPSELESSMPQSPALAPPGSPGQAPVQGGQSPRM